MIHEDEWKLPDGLPATFVGDEGFDRLCKFLGIVNRQHKQKICGCIKAEYPELHAGLPKKLTASQRFQELLTRFYTSASARRRHWNASIKASDSDHLNTWPCLEDRALRSFDQEFQNREIEREKLDEALASFSGVVSLPDELPDCQRAALALWPALQSKVLDWGTLDDAGRTEVTLAVFAVATILDDVRVLQWAANSAGPLASEFAFAVDCKEVSSEGVSGVKRQTADELMRSWRDECRSAARLASDLEEGLADSQVYEEFRSHVKALEDLRSPVLSIINQRSSAEQVKHMVDAIEDMAAEFEAPWLQRVAKSIGSQWNTTYLIAGPVDAEKLSHDIERAKRESRAAVAEWKSVVEEKQQLTIELAKARTALEDDNEAEFDGIDKETELYQALADVGKRIKQASRNTLDSAVPDGEKFAPERTARDETGVPTATVIPKPPRSAASPSSSARSGAIAATEGEDEVEPSGAVGSSCGESQPEHDEEQASSVAGSIESDAKSTATRVRPTGTEDRSEAPRPSGIPNGRDAEIEVLWKAIPDRPGIAFHIARLLGDDGCDHPALPQADLIGAAVLARFIRAGDESAARALKEYLGRIGPTEFSRADSEIQDSLNLLLFSAAARPALVAPMTGATFLLRATKLGAALSPVYELATVVADHADRLGHSVRFDASVITAVVNQASWLQDFESTRARARDWLSNAGRQKIKYQPALRVWRLWLRESECLGKLAKLVAEGDTTERDAVDSLRREVGNEQSFADLVRKADRSLRGGKHANIEGRALSQLRKHAQPLLDLAADWIRLVDAKSHSTGFIERSIQSLDKSVQSLGERAVAAIDDVAAATECQQLRVSLALAKDTVQSLRDLLRDGTPPRQHVSNPDVIIHRDLLLVPRLNIDSQFKPIGRPLDVLAMLADTGEHANTMRACFDSRFERGDLVGASLACLEMESSGDPEAQQIRASVERTLRQRRIESIKECDAHLDALEQSLSFGQLDERTSESLRAEIVSVASALERAEVSVGDFSVDRAQARTREIAESIASWRRKGQATASAKFNSLLSECTPDVRSRIERSIAAGDLMTAYALISRVESGQPLDSHDHETSTDPFREFMSAVGKIDEFIGDARRTPASKVRAVSESGGIIGAGLEGMSKAGIEEAEELLGAWYGLAVAKRFEGKSLNRLMQALGLPPRKLTETERGNDYATVMMETDRIEDRLRCPLPQFGSDAGGRYRLVLNWAKIARESISRLINNRRHGATIVLHFGPLGKDRYWLRNWAITQHRLFVVVDESLALFLAGRPSGRLSALFRCVLPFSDAEPYITTSGLVPPELFFGRARERNEIMESTGPCFIYGGRQLGKTALLRSVEREFHQPDRQQFAKWIDLRVREIGHARRSAEIWPLLWREMRAPGILQDSHKEPNPDNPRQVDTLIQAIERWVTDGDQRRLLLLLDEADEFLAADARTDFRESTRLKGMMDRTDRRVKVVFAGLHNVLRITERSNHPLAHLGEPINVGPLLANGEWAEAQKLVRDPLQAVGFEFSPHDLSTRILAQTNYYPSLIQLYGAELVRHLRDSGRSVPYSISDADMGAAYKSRALRDAIRERFQLTLQLDPRYEVIAYALASEMLGEDQDLGRGLDRRELAEHAREWWRAGFSDDDREFNVLLQEMEGLGVLRSISADGRYTLRNPNVLRLLGSRDEIYEVLDKQREEPTRFEPSSFHARYSEDDTSLCPLTYEQESGIRRHGGVAVIAGCEAAGIQDVKRFLSKRIERASFSEFSSHLSVRTFRQQLGSLRPKSPNLTTVVVVPHEEPWSVDWLIAAREALRVKKAGDRIRVLFVADPNGLWAVMNELEHTRVEPPEWIGIEPWDEVFLRHWLRDNSRPHDSERVRQLMRISGGWPKVLEAFVDQRQKRKNWDGLIEALNGALEKTDDWLTAMGLTSEAQLQLAAMLPYQPIRSDSNDDIDVIAEGENIDANDLRRRVRWGQRLGLVKDSGGQWEFNPLLQRILRSRFDE